MNAVLAVALAYIVGSVPFALLVAGRQGIDLRETGSGNIGAANVLRTTGARAAVLALVLDGVKGVAAVLVAQWLSPGQVVPVVAGCASVVGHVYPVWLRFRGGKGVATAAGAFAVLAPVALVVAVAAFGLAVARSRFVSAGSIAGAVTLVVMTLVTGAPGVVTAGAVAAALIVLYRHQDNVARLMAGTEQRIGHRAVKQKVR